MKKLLSVLLLLVLLTGCTGPQSPETTVPPTEATTAPTTVPPTTLPPTTAPEETEPVKLQKGFYTLAGAWQGDHTYDTDDLPDFQSYLFLEEDGTGVLAVLGSRWSIDWTENRIVLYGTPLPLAADGDTFIVTIDTLDLAFRFESEDLPEAYQSQIPAGTFLVSSVGVNGDVSFYGSLDPANGSLTLKEDGTGTLVFDDLNGDVTIDGENIYFGDMVIPYMYYTEAMSPDGEAMLMILLTDRTTSVIFRVAPEDAE